MPDPQLIQVKKYPNRRLYDQTRSRHMTHEELYDLVVAGHTVSVTGKLTIKNSLVVSGKNAINVLGAAVISVDNSILVGQNAVISSRGASLVIAKNSVFHGKRDVDGAFVLIDLGGNTFE